MTTLAVTPKIGESAFSSIGFGAMTISAPYGGGIQSDEERFKILDRAYELGCTHWDTADIYGDSEELIGKWFKRTGKRIDIFLATKFGFAPDGVRGDAPYVKECAERSLSRLGVDHIDLLYLHRVDKNTPIEETVGAMAEFVRRVSNRLCFIAPKPPHRAGKVKHLGLSECSSNALRRAQAVYPIAAIQVEYSPFTLDIEDPNIALLKTARELGVKIVAYSPLGRGLLTGQVKSADEFENNDLDLVSAYRDNFPKILAISDNLRAIGLKHGASAGQVALAWLLAQGEDIIPIPGTKKIKYLEENIAAAKLQLSAEEVQEVRRSITAAALDNTSGRYPPGMVEQLFVDSPPLRK